MKRRNKGLSFYTKERKIKPETIKEIWSYLFWIAAMCLVAAVVVFCVGMRTSMIGVSMEPTLADGQEIFVNRISYLVIQPSRNDVVVFLPNGNKNVHYYIKRVIGLPGETIQIKGGKIYINGELYEEEFTFDKIVEGGLAEKEFVLAEDEYFVLGDNRNISEDSRSGNIGGVSKDDIIGEAWYCLSKDDVQAGFIK